MLHPLKSYVNSKVSVAVLAEKFLDITVFVMPNSILCDVTGMTVKTIGNEDGRDHNAVLCSDLFPNLNGKFYGMNVFATDMSVCVILTRTFPFKISLNYIEPFDSSLRMNTIMTVTNSNNVVALCNLFSFFFTRVYFCHLCYVYYTHSYLTVVYNVCYTQSINTK